MTIDEKPTSLKKCVRSRMMTSPIHMLGIFIIGLAIGLYLSRLLKSEGFSNYDSNGDCNNGSSTSPACPECKQPDMNKYVLKSSIPPCPALPDLSNYILKSECPPVPDLSNYVLKSSIPKQNPVILDCSKCQKPKGECPPCPRSRCPEVTCPPAAKCPTCAPCPRQSCPPAVVKCKAENPVSDSAVRPYLAPLNYRGFGLD